MIKDLLKLADSLDRDGFHKEADHISLLLNNIKRAADKLDLGIAGVAAGTMGSSSVGSLLSAGAAAGAALTGGTIAAGMIGWGLGTKVYEALESSGLNSSMRNWLLSPNLKNGTKYNIKINTSINPAVLKDAVSFIPQGVSGILVKEDGTVLNKNSSGELPDAKAVRINDIAKVTCPKKEGGVLIPTEIIVQIIYKDGKRSNAKSYPKDVITNLASNEVNATISIFGRAK